MAFIYEKINNLNFRRVVESFLELVVLINS